MNVKMTVIVDNVPSGGLKGEWGLCILVEAGDKKILVDSAGCFTSGGDFMSRGAREVLADNGVDFGRHLSKTFTEREYQNFRRVVALDNEVMEKAVEISHGDPDKKIRLLNVEDPAFDGDFRRAYKEIYRGCQELFNELAQ